MTLTEFNNNIKNVSNHRIHKVSKSLGVYDAYKWIRKNKWFDIGQPITEKQFYTIIREINKYLAKKLTQGYDITLPCNMGKLELRKSPVRFKLTDDKLISNLPINWKETIKLWYEDEEAYTKRTLVKMEEKELFKVFYNRHKANYPNKTFYKFNINREIKLNLKNQIKENNIDAFTF